MSKPKAIVISAADDNYLSLAQDLFHSIQAQTFAYEFDLGLLDVGLSEPSRAWFKANNIHTEPVKSDIQYPARAAWEARVPSYRTLSARPFLRRYFPGYDVYIWMDADVWVQTPDALNTMIEGASTSSAIHLSVELDRCYKMFFEDATMWSVYNGWYQACYNDDLITATMTLKPMLNAGVSAMSKDSPVWETWLKIYADALQKLPELDNKTFMTDQLALNIAVFMKNMPHVIMPAAFNWLTFFAIPVWDKKTSQYVEPMAPYRPISQFHLTQKPKLQVEKITCTDGTIIERPLTYRARNS
ncbi:MAG: hypothetical protein WAO98_02065 [Alphaproteobacteria bacterium]